MSSFVYDDKYVCKDVCMQWSFENLKNGQMWLRVGYTLLVLIVLGYLWVWIFYLLALIWFAQSIFWLFSGAVNEDGVTYTRFLSLSFYQYLEYLTYTSKEKPYPLDLLP